MKMIKSIITTAVIAIAITSCTGNAARERAEEAKHIERLQTEGFDRLMVEECGHFKIDYDKHIAYDTTKTWRFRVYKLNEDSTRYILCK